MAVLAASFSVVIRRARADAVVPGGAAAIESACPNGSFCADDDLLRVGFMTTRDLHRYVGDLIGLGLVHTRDGAAADFAVVSQHEGILGPCDWLAFEFLVVDGHAAPACYLAGSVPASLSASAGWAPGAGTSFRFLAAADGSSGITFVRRDGAIDVYLDERTGQELYAGRAFAEGEFQGNEEGRR